MTGKSAREVGAEIGAAMTAASSVPLALNWTDVIKTRMQGASVEGCTAPPYTGGFTAVGKRILAEEGAWALWSTGMPASLGRECTVIGSRMGAYPATRDFISFLSGGDGGGSTGVGSKLGAGVVLGAVSGWLATPFDLVRIMMQAEAGLSDANGVLTTGLRAGKPRELRSTPHAFAGIVQKGALGLFRGSGVNVVRSILMTVGTVPVYEHTKHLAKTHLDVADSPVLHFGSGIVAGLVGTTVTMPADVIRTRVMSGRGVSFAEAASGIAREHGPMGFVRGWVPAYTRIGPLFLLMPALVEQVRVRLFGLSYMV